MSKYTNPAEEAAILGTINSFLATLTSSSPQDESQQYILDTEHLPVLSAFLGQGAFAAETAIKPQGGTFKLSTTAPAPEVFVKDPIAAAWAVVDHESEDGVLKSRGYTSISFVKISDSWKISLANYGGRGKGTELPTLSTTKPPGVERLMEFANLIFRDRVPVRVEEWCLPHARMVRNKGGFSLASAVEKAHEAAAKLPSDANWNETFEDMTIRIAGDRGMLWYKYTVYVQNKVTGTGIDVLLLTNDGSQWLFDGTQALNVMLED